MKEFLTKQATPPPLRDRSDLTRSYSSISSFLLKTALSSLVSLNSITAAFASLAIQGISSILGRKLFIFKYKWSNGQSSIVSLSNMVKYDLHNFFRYKQGYLVQNGHPFLFQIEKGRLSNRIFFETRWHPLNLKYEKSSHARITIFKYHSQFTDMV